MHFCSNKALVNHSDFFQLIPKQQRESSPFNDFKSPTSTYITVFLKGNKNETRTLTQIGNLLNYLENERKAIRFKHEPPDLFLLIPDIFHSLTTNVISWRYYL
jgi:hypothetical protein